MRLKSWVKARQLTQDLTLAMATSCIEAKVVVAPAHHLWLGVKVVTVLSPKEHVTERCPELSRSDVYHTPLVNCL
jgi:hypothetical protein